MAHGETSPCIPKTGIKPFNGHLFRTCYILYIIYGCRTLYLLSKACFAIYPVSISCLPSAHFMFSLCLSYVYHMFLKSTLCLPYLMLIACLMSLCHLYVSQDFLMCILCVPYAHLMSYLCVMSILCLLSLHYVYLMCSLCLSYVYILPILWRIWSGA